MSRKPCKRLIYLGEFNLLMDGATYLPLVSGLLRANAELSPMVREHFDFAPFLFLGERPEKLADRYVNPSVAAFSSSMWNANLNLAVARRVKDRYPACLVIFGGPNVPHRPEDFLRDHPFIDVAVRGEGERPFSTLLERLAAAPGAGDVDLDDIPGTTWRVPTGELRHCSSEQDLEKDLDVFPSAYLEGLFDPIFHDHPELDFQCIIETNRGCPFQCTFCYWGKGGLSQKFRFHGLERVKAEIDWMAEKKIKYVFNADSNFGMHRRDLEIANYLISTKQRTGYPAKFRTCYGKNTDELIFSIGKLFHENGLEKGITISYQSVDELVQKNIQRQNIRLDRAHELQRKFNESGVPVYTELILGLPGETYRSWVAGVNRVLGSGLKNQLFMYICQVYPGTRLADPDYRNRFGLITRTLRLNEIHGVLPAPGSIPEEEVIVVATDAMPSRDWRRALIFSWVTMTLHSLKLGFFVLAWLADRFGLEHGDFLEYVAERKFPTGEYPLIESEIDHFETRIELLLEGHGRGSELDGFGNLFWDEEEACFLRLSADFDAFYAQFQRLTARFLEERGLAFKEDELDQVMRFQSLAIPRPNGSPTAISRFELDVLDYFTALFSTRPVPLRISPTTLQVSQPDFAGDLARYARETILWGRKSGTMLTQIRKAETPILVGSTPG